MNATAVPGLFDPLAAEPVRYFRNCRQDSYCTLQGETVLYFTPDHHDGFDTSEDITRAVVLKYAEKQPHLDGEITLKEVDKIRQGWSAPPPIPHPR